MRTVHFRSVAIAATGVILAMAGSVAAQEKPTGLLNTQSFMGNPSRNLGTGMSVHCKRLADLNTEPATTVRELAADHEKLASGMAATPPRDTRIAWAAVHHDRLAGLARDSAKEVKEAADMHKQLANITR